MKRAVLLIPLWLAATISIRAQSIGPNTVNATGSTAIIGSTEVDWSVGEMTMVSTFTSASIVVTQGVLQPANANVSVPQNSLLKNQLKVFPNPVTSLVNLQYSSQTPGTLAYKLLDITGKVLGKQTIEVTPGTTTEQIDVKELACATYMLEVTVTSGNSAPESISYKIQKLK